MSAAGHARHRKRMQEDPVFAEEHRARMRKKAAEKRAREPLTDADRAEIARERAAQRAKAIAQDPTYLDRARAANRAYKRRRRAAECAVLLRSRLLVAQIDAAVAKAAAVERKRITRLEIIRRILVEHFNGQPCDIDDCTSSPIDQGASGTNP